MTPTTLFAFVLAGLAAAIPLAWLGDLVMSVFRDDAGEIQ